MAVQSSLARSLRGTSSSPTRASSHAPAPADRAPSADLLRLPGETRLAPRLRALAYAIYLGVLLALVLTRADDPTVRGRNMFFAEGSPVESLQAIHLGLATGLFAVAAARAFRSRSDQRWMFAIFLIGTGFAVHREFDFFWKRQGLDSIYHALKYVIGLPALAILAVRFSSLLALWLRRPFWLPYTLLFIAIGGYATAQLLTPTLELLGVVHTYTRIAEEGVELLSGVFFVLAAAELLLRWVPRAPGA